MRAPAHPKRSSRKTGNERYNSSGRYQTIFWRRLCAFRLKRRIVRRTLVQQYASLCVGRNVCPYWDIDIFLGIFIWIAKLSLDHMIEKRECPGNCRFIYSDRFFDKSVIEILQYRV